MFLQYRDMWQSIMVGYCDMSQYKITHSEGHIGGIAGAHRDPQDSRRYQQATCNDRIWRYNTTYRRGAVGQIPGCVGG